MQPEGKLSDESESLVSGHSDHSDMHSTRHEKLIFCTNSNLNENSFQHIDRTQLGLTKESKL